ncbi:DUF4252 domain-containing protein [Parabacteroides sp. PF5-9]|uniref:DUF4252 domain-containing protein n=1 Tax=Parabacteroides sp. PF5-9 TaxID=1742404 RepID=UPI002472FF3F|nr:DUF4252 domain-containing protein [Parabacteroides sp. PF5-9]MDH6356313.1 hypothetical protein [Parabacteroides sp. PF5-9]
MKTKYILILLIFCAITGKSFGQSKLFDKYAEMDNVTSVYISKAMFQMMPAIEGVGTSLMNLKGKVESLQLVSTERPDQIPQMRKEFVDLIGKQHAELMRVRHSKTKATFYADMKGDQIKDLLMLADTDSSFTVIQLKGDFTLQEIQEIAKEME